MSERLATLIRIGLALLLLTPHITSADAFIPDLWWPDVVPRSVVFRVGVIVLVGLWAVLACLDRRYRPKIGGGLLAYAVFVAVIAVADLLGVHPERSIHGHLERMEGLVGHLHLLGFMLVASSVLRTPGQWKVFFHISLAVCLSVTVFAVLQYFGLSPVHGKVSDERFFRANARLGNPVFLAVYTLFHVFIAAFYGVREQRPLARAGYGLLIAAFVVTLVLTATRSAILGLGTGAVAACLTAFALSGFAGGQGRRRLVVAAGVVVGVILLAVGVYLVKPGFITELPIVNRLFALNFDASARLTVWKIGLEAAMEHPLLGWGQENFIFAFDRHYDPRLIQLTKEPWWDHAHNAFIGWLVAGGILGLAAYLGLFLVPLRSLLTRRTAFMSPGERGVLVGLLVAYATYLFFMLDNLTSYMMFLAVLAFLHASITYHERASAAEDPEAVDAPQPTARPWLAIPVAILAVVLAPLAMRGSLDIWNAARKIQEAIAAPWVRNPTTGEVRHTIRDAIEASRGTPAITDARYQAASLADGSAPANLRGAVRDLAFLEMRDEIDRHPEDAVPLEAYMRMAAMLLGNGDQKSAISYLQRAAKAYPSRQMVYMTLGDAYLALKDPEAAAEAFGKVLELSPGYIPARERFCIATIRSGDKEAARGAMKQACKPGMPAPPAIVAAIMDMEWQGAAAGEWADLLVPVQETALMVTVHRIKKKKTLKKRKAIDAYHAVAFAQAEAGQPERAIRTLDRLFRSIERAGTMARFWAGRVFQGKTIGYRAANGLYYPILPEMRRKGVPGQMRPDHPALPPSSFADLFKAQNTPQARKAQRRANGAGKGKSGKKKAPRKKKKQQRKK